jgi:hypothetical protein
MTRILARAALALCPAIGGPGPSTTGRPTARWTASQPVAMAILSLVPAVRDGTARATGHAVSRTAARVILAELAYRDR